MTAFYLSSISDSAASACMAQPVNFRIKIIRKSVDPCLVSSCICFVFHVFFICLVTFAYRQAIDCFALRRLLREVSDVTRLLVLRVELQQHIQPNTLLFTELLSGMIATLQSTRCCFDWVVDSLDCGWHANQTDLPYTFFTSVLCILCIGFLYLQFYLGKRSLK